MSSTNKGPFIPPYTVLLIKKYKKELLRVLSQFPSISHSFFTPKFNALFGDILNFLNLDSYTVKSPSSEFLLKNIPFWLFNDNLVLLHYKSDSGDGIVNILRAIKKHSEKVSFENLLPIFYTNATGKKQVEVFRLLGNFGIKHVIFLTPSAPIEVNIEELFEGIIEYGKHFTEDDSGELDSDGSKPKIEDIKRYTTLVKEADALMLAGKYLEAIEFYSQAIEIKPDFDVLIHRGDSYYSIKEFVLALKDYRRATKLHHEIAEPFVKMSTCCFRVVKKSLNDKDTEKAEKYFAIGVKSLKEAKINVSTLIKENYDRPEKIPEYPYKSILSALVEAEVTGLEIKKAQEELNTLTEEVINAMSDYDFLDNSLDISFRIDFAILLTRLGYHEKAENIFRKIISENEKMVIPAFNNFAIELRKKGNHGKAFEIYLEILQKKEVEDKAIVIENLKTAGLRYARKLRENFKMDDAINVYKDILSYKPKEKEWVLCELAMTFLELQNQAEASSRLMEAIYINPSLSKATRFKNNYPDLFNIKEEMIKKLSNAT
ncbi:MAG: hypothetical protein HQK84_06410 [Nitrospinae bacterium]|nr:hypothetical protein [Nitrospinota bacterium]